MQLLIRMSETEKISFHGGEYSDIPWLCLENGEKNEEVDIFFNSKEELKTFMETLNQEYGKLWM